MFHHALCRSGRLAQGGLLPVSIAMKRHEADYLAALQSFSKPVRRLWQVTWIDDEQFQFHFQGADAVYRYWDATPCVEFSYRMAEQALNIDLRRETDFLSQFDRISQALNQHYDLRSNDQHLLIISALQNNGIVSKHRRKQLADRVPEGVFDFLEHVIATH
jgi:hypothetical protein